jgi:hypothetical protein
MFFRPIALHNYFGVNVKCWSRMLKSFMSISFGSL